MIHQIANQSLYYFRKVKKFFIFSVLLFINFATYADLIFLKDETIVEGKFVSEDRYNVKVNDGIKDISIPKKNILKIEMGYTGLPFCYTLKKDPEKEICNTLLHQITEKEIVIISGRGNTTTKTIRIKDIDMFIIKDLKSDSRITDVIKPKSKVTIQKSKDSITGDIESIVQNEISIKSETDGKTYTVKESEVVQTKYITKRETKVAKSIRYTSYLIPGAYSFKKSKIKGSIIFSLFLFSAIQIPIRYVAAQYNIVNDVDYVMYNNQVLMVNNLGPNHSYENNMRGFQAAIVASSLLYLYHSYDVYSGLNEESKQEAEVSLKVIPDISPMAGSQTMRSGYSIQFGYQLRF